MDDEWNWEYTNEALTEQLGLLELHYNDGSYRECSCVPEKHLPLIAGLASEAVQFSHKVGKDELTPFYRGLADWAREARKLIEEGDYSHIANSPELRKYLPHGLTEEEKVSKTVQHKLSSCIKAAEEKYCGDPSDYSTCSYNPAAICRSSIEQHG